MHRIPLLCFAILSAGAVSGSTQIPQVRVEPAIPSVSSNLQEQTRDAVIRDYLHSWRTMSAAFEQNRAVLLEAEFVGVAKEKMTDAILQQARLGIRTRYAVRSHDLQLTFFSPEGLSVELTDKVVYDFQLIDHGKVIAKQQMISTYVVVLTPAETRWRVRVFQAIPNDQMPVN